MKNKSGACSTRLVWLASLLVLLAVPALAHDATDVTEAAHHHEAGAEVDNSGYFNAYHFDYELASKKLFGLASAIPAEKYGWRPGEGVRSVSESLMHVVWTTGFLGQKLDIAQPENWPEDLEAITDKKKVLKYLRGAIQHGRDILEAHHNVDLEGRDVDFAGGNSKPRLVLFVLLSHMHEHLGQMIAYARINEIAPPWDNPLAANLEKP